MPLAMPIIETQHFSEEIPGLTQAKLCMLFTRGTPEDLPSITVMRMAMSVFGGSTTSRLFRMCAKNRAFAITAVPALCAPPV